jgi:hypothetical protein
MEYVIAVLLFLNRSISGMPYLFYVLSAGILIWYAVGRRKSLRAIGILSLVMLIYTAVVCVITGSGDIYAAGSFWLHTALNIILMVWTANNVEKLEGNRFLVGIAALFGIATAAAIVMPGSWLWKAQEYVDGFGPERLRLLYPEPAYLSIICGALLVLALYFMIARKFRYRILLAGAVFLLCMVLSYGLGGMIACAISITALIMVHVARNRDGILGDPLKKYSWALVFGILLVVIIAIISISPIYAMRVLPLAQGSDNGLAYTVKRPFEWFVSIMNRTGWKGTGIGQLVGTEIGKELGIELEFKNSFLRIMAEGGILGIILVAVIVTYFIGQCLLYGNELAVALTIYTIVIQFSTGDFEDPVHFLVYGIILHECMKERELRRLKSTEEFKNNDNLLAMPGYAVFDGRYGQGSGAGDGKKIKVCLVGSSGGHLTHLYMLKPFWENKDRFWVTFDKEDARSLLEHERMIPCYYPTNRSLKAFIINSTLAFRVLGKERPDLIISSGAAVAVPFFYIGKLFGAKCIYIEVFDRIDKPTMTGKMVYPITDRFIVQWEEMKKVYPNSINLGSIF